MEVTYLLQLQSAAVYALQRAFLVTTYNTSAPEIEEGDETDLCSVLQLQCVVCRSVCVRAAMGLPYLQ